MIRRALLLLVLLAFVVVTQLWLSTAALFGPDRGELGGAVGAAIIAVTAYGLVYATKPEAPLMAQPRLLAAVMTAMWLCLAAMLAVVVFDTPWQLVSVPMWLNPSEPHNVLRPALWLPFHLFHTAGPLCLALAITAKSHGTKARWRIVAGGVLPWLLASVGYQALMQMRPPGYAG